MENLVKLNYCKNQNFGDELAPYLVEKIPKRGVVWGSGRGSISAIGSILNYEEIRNGGVIWGSGVMTRRALKCLPYVFPLSRTIPALFHRLKDNKKVNCDVRLLRGKLSRNLLQAEGVKCPEIFGDPAIVVRRFFMPPIQPRYAFGLVCHRSHEGMFGSKQIERLGGRLIAIHRTSYSDLESFIAEVCQCHKIFSSSLHGLIIAHVYGVPAQWVQLKNKKIHRDQEFKFYDYFSGLDLLSEGPIVIDNSSIQDLKMYHPRKIIIKEKFLDQVLSVFPFDAI